MLMHQTGSLRSSLSALQCYIQTQSAIKNIRNVKMAPSYYLVLANNSMGSLLLVEPRLITS